MQAATGTRIGEALAERLARGARREAEALARLLAADLAAVRDRVIAFADADDPASRGRGGRSGILADLLSCTLAAGDAGASARVVRALEREAAIADSAADAVDRSALARARTALCAAGRGTAPMPVAPAPPGLTGGDGRCEPAATAAGVSLLGHALLGARGAGFAADGGVEAGFRAGLQALLDAQDDAGGWTRRAVDDDVRDETAHVLDDAFAIALLREDSPTGTPTSIVAASAARGLACLASTQSAAGDWEGDLRSTIANLRAAMLVLPLVEERFPGVVRAAAFPASARGGRFVERGFAWCLSRKPDLGWGEPGDSAEASIGLAAAGAALLREYGAWREGTATAPARARGLA